MAIKIIDVLESNITSNILAYSDNIYDKDTGRFQSDINAELLSGSGSNLEIKLGTALALNSDGKIGVSIGSALKIDTFGKLSVSVGNGLTVNTDNNITLNLGSGLKISSNKLCISTADLNIGSGSGGSSYIFGSGLELSSGTVSVKIGTQYDANGLELSTDAGALRSETNGLILKLATFIPNDDIHTAGLEMVHNGLRVKIGSGLKLSETGEVEVNINDLKKMLGLIA